MTDRHVRMIAAALFAFVGAILAYTRLEEIALLIVTSAAFLFAFDAYRSIKDEGEK